MGKKEIYKAPRGTYDILPADSYKWEYVRNCFREIAQSFNFSEIVTPIFENAELFERSVGNETDIIEKEMYKFTDRKGRLLALRPEGTASVVRSYIENNLDKEGSFSKLYYMGPMFRYDRPQKGRYRQFYQYGIEYIGSENPYTDAEVISLAAMFIDKLGLKQCRLEINSIGCPNCSKDYDKAIISYYRDYEKDLCPDCSKRIINNPKRLLDCKIEKCRSIANNAPSVLDSLDDSCRNHFDKLCSYLDIMGIEYTINSRIVRGLDYYSRTAFELIDETSNTQNALLGGGRYDGLISSLGGKDTPAVGFAGGFERLLAAMEKQNLSFGNKPKTDVYIITMGEQADNLATKLCYQLRMKSINVEYEQDKYSFKPQLKAAVKNGAKLALIIGDDEINQGLITIKDISQETQNTYPQNTIIEEIINQLGKYNQYK